jgi:uncharacterized SAM-binding protein YcdF (DUF218 family)
MDNLFFVFSKLFWIIASPTNLLIILFIVGTLLLVFKAHKAALLTLIPSALLAGLLMIYPIGDYIIQPLETRFAQPTTLPTDMDGIIVLGGGEDLKRSVSWQTAELGQGGDRYLAAKALADRYPQAKVIFTGGSGLFLNPTSDKDGVIARTIFKQLDIDSSRYILETQSRNTYENFLNTAPLLKPDGHYFLVTSAYHMPRSVGIARRFKLNIIPYPVDFRSNQNAMRYANFNFFENAETLEKGVKEWLGLLAYSLTGKSDALYPAQ